MSTSINLSVANFPQVTTSQITWINLRVQQFHPKQFYRAVPRPPICCCHAFVFICGRPRVDTHTYAGLKESCLASPPPDVMLQRSFSYFGFKSIFPSLLSLFSSFLSPRKLTDWQNVLGQVRTPTPSPSPPSRPLSCRGRWRCRWRWHHHILTPNFQVVVDQCACKKFGLFYSKGECASSDMQPACARTTATITTTTTIATTFLFSCFSIILCHT